MTDTIAPIPIPEPESEPLVVEEPVEIVIVRPESKPIEHARHDGPTHIKWDTGEHVFPDGIDPDMLTPIKPEWLKPFMVPDLANRTFVPDLDAARTAQWEAIKIYREQIRFGGCDTPLGRMDTDAESQRKINDAVTMAMLIGDTFTIDWTMEDNSVVTHDAEAMKAASVAVSEFDSTCHAVSVALREEIQEANTLEEILAITPQSVQWPS